MVDYIKELFTKTTPVSLLTTALLKAPVYNPFFDGEVLSQVSHVQNLSSTSQVRWMTGGVIRSFDRWGWNALVRSYPLLVSELFFYSFTEHKLESAMGEFKFFEAESDRSLLTTSKVFLKATL